MSREITVAELLSRYRVILLDAYGVLIEAGRALPGARELISHFASTAHEYFVVTNDASRSAETCSARYRGFGVPVPPERVVTSGSLLREYYRAHSLAGAGTVVLGPEDSKTYVREAGGVVVDIDDPRARVLVAADEAGYPFLESVDAAMSMVLLRLDDPAPFHLVVPNPDLIYPAGPGRWGFAAGTIAQMFESALALRHPGDPRAKFARLGKPSPQIFEAALQRAGAQKEDAVMIGDQLETDIRGANAAGIDSVLVASGVSRAHEDHEVQPTYRLSSFALDAG